VVGTVDDTVVGVACEVPYCLLNSSIEMALPEVVIARLVGAVVVVVGRVVE